MTDQQIARQDEVDNVIHDVLELLVPNDNHVEWDIELIGKVRDAIQEVLVEDLKVCTEQEFYPYEKGDDDPEYILDCGEIREV
jgi:hypothetical protein